MNINETFELCFWNSVLGIVCLVWAHSCPTCVNTFVCCWSWWFFGSSCCIKDRLPIWFIPIKIGTWRLLILTKRSNLQFSIVISTGRLCSSKFNLVHTLPCSLLQKIVSLNLIFLLWFVVRWSLHALLSLNDHISEWSSWLLVPLESLVVSQLEIIQSLVCFVAIWSQTFKLVFLLCFIQFINKCIPFCLAIIPFCLVFDFVGHGSSIWYRISRDITIKLSFCFSHEHITHWDFSIRIIKFHSLALNWCLWEPIIF